MAVFASEIAQCIYMIWRMGFMNSAYKIIQILMELNNVDSMAIAYSPIICMQVERKYATGTFDKAIPISSQ